MSQISLPEPPSFRLDGKRALVTGGGRGLGLAASSALAAAGAHVTLVARSPDEIGRAAGAIRATGMQAISQSLDVSDLDAVDDFFAQRPAFDFVLNNAGANRPQHFTRVERADFDAVISLNLKSAFFVSQAASRRMIADGVRGSLVHMSSQMGHVGGPNRSVYCASKWALEGMSKAIALDLAPHGIRSNTIAPTFIETPMSRPFLEDPSSNLDRKGVGIS
jgi:NAD(P)-dependent dehydrogenase (short-subunit alcohol dehydrogenase family)